MPADPESFVLIGRISLLALLGIGARLIASRLASSRSDS